MTKKIYLQDVLLENIESNLLDSKKEDSIDSKIKDSNLQAASKDSKNIASSVAQNTESKLFINDIPSPSYVLCFDSLMWNLRTLKDVADKSGAQILIALKGYSFWREFAPVRQLLSGATCSGLHETLLAYEEITLKHLQNYLDSKNEDSKNTAENIESKQDSKKSKESTESSIYKEICVFSPAYKMTQMQEIVKYATHIIFNSFTQWEKFKDIIESRNAEIRAFWATQDSKDSKQIAKKIIESKIQPKEIEVGLRINPLYSEVTPPIYNPCIPKSRLGIPPKEFKKNLKKLAKKYGYATKKEFFSAHFSGLHFHTHCEQDSTALQRTLPHVTKHFKKYLHLSKWVNFGGGHHITRDDYDISLLVKLVRKFRAKYNVAVFLEPGEAVGWECGDLVGEVIDIVRNKGKVAVLDISASAHMPDCLEMPYRPQCYKISRLQSMESRADSKSDSRVKWSIERDLGEGVGAYRYRFGGPTCLAGDVIGDYSFSTPLNIGDKVAFCDMMHYTIVKNTTFNGVELPSLCVIKNKKLEILKQFGYKDFKDRN